MLRPNRPFRTIMDPLLGRDLVWDDLWVKYAHCAKDDAETVWLFCTIGVNPEVLCLNSPSPNRVWAYYYKTQTCYNGAVLTPAIESCCHNTTPALEWCRHNTTSALESCCYNTTPVFECQGAPVIKLLGECWPSCSDKNKTVIVLFHARLLKHL